MRKCNAILTPLILVLFLLHAIFGSFQLLGVGNTALKTVSWVAVGLIVIHTAIGVKLTFDTLKAQRKTKAAYWKENRVFWASRISGFAVMALLIFHLTAFGYYTGEGAYRLHWFTAGKLAAQVLLAAAVAVHVAANIRPMMISLGIRSLKQWTGDIFIVLSVSILFITAAFIVYYLRWNVF